MNSKHILELTEYTDPYCTWCWGSEPVLRKIAEVFGAQVKIGFKMGGLVADIKTFCDASNGICGSTWHVQVAEHWLEASQRHGMPVDEQIFHDLKDANFSTYPACIAYKSAQFQDEALANRFLRSIREAVAAERKDIQRLDVLAERAGKIGLDTDQFTADIESGKAGKAFEEDLKWCREHGAHGFPTFSVRNPSDNKELVLHGYRRFDEFHEAFRSLAGNAVKPNFPKAGRDSIFSFVEKYQKVAPREITEVFTISDKEIDEYLAPFVLNGTVQKTKAGNGVFYSQRID